jgi:hypothetical protein
MLRRVRAVFVTAPRCITSRSHDAGAKRDGSPARSNVRAFSCDVGRYPSPVCVDIPRVGFRVAPDIVTNGAFEPTHRQL